MAPILKLTLVFSDSFTSRGVENICLLQKSIELRGNNKLNDTNIPKNPTKNVFFQKDIWKLRIF